MSFIFLLQLMDQLRGSQRYRCSSFALMELNEVVFYLHSQKSRMDQNMPLLSARTGPCSVVSRRRFNAPRLPISANRFGGFSRGGTYAKTEVSRVLVLQKLLNIIYPCAQPVKLKDRINIVLGSAGPLAFDWCTSTYHMQQTPKNHSMEVESRPQGTPSSKL
jgi:hypothetical protein